MDPAAPLRNTGIREASRAVGGRGDGRTRNGEKGGTTAAALLVSRRAPDRRHSRSRRARAAAHAARWQGAPPSPRRPAHPSPRPAPPHHATRHHCVASPTPASTDCQPATRRGTAERVARQSLPGRRRKRRRGAPPPRGDRPDKATAAHRGERGGGGERGQAPPRTGAGGEEVDTALGGGERQARRGGRSAPRCLAGDAACQSPATAVGAAGGGRRPAPHRPPRATVAGAVMQGAVCQPASRVACIRAAAQRVGAMVVAIAAAAGARWPCVLVTTGQHGTHKDRPCKFSSMERLVLVESCRVELRSSEHWSGGGT